MANKDYEELVRYWDSAFGYAYEEEKENLKDIKEDDWKDLAPSKKLFDAVMEYKGKEKVLDYGCGTGWASILLAKAGVKEIISVDVSANGIKSLKAYAEAFGVQDQIKAGVINENWLKKQKDGTFDGFFTSNVLDVIPLEMSKEIIREAARVCRKDARIVFSFNYYADPKAMEERGFLVKGINVYYGDALRLVCVKDEEWKALFEEYFEVISLDYFAWPTETTERRRLFVLKKK